MGGVSDTFTSTTLAGDAVPVPFSFPNQTGVELRHGHHVGPGDDHRHRHREPGDGHRRRVLDRLHKHLHQFPGQHHQRATVCVRHRSSFNSSEDVETILTIGTESDSFTSTTRIGDQLPDDFSFTSQANVARDARVVSNPITVTGTDSKAAILLSGPTGDFGRPLYGFSRGCTGTDVGADDDQLLDPGETSACPSFRPTATSRVSCSP